jgi:hypothetical protein
LRDGIDIFSVALDGEERGRGGEVAVPNIVVRALKMPEALTGLRV